MRKKRIHNEPAWMSREIPSAISQKKEEDVENSVKQPYNRRQQGGGETAEKHDQKGPKIFLQKAGRWETRACSIPTYVKQQTKRRTTIGPMKNDRRGEQWR
jgi:hypothetical protein